MKITDSIDTITCDCGLKFSMMKTCGFQHTQNQRFCYGMKYYKEHMSDVKEAVRLLQYKHKIKTVTYIQKQTKVK